MLPLSLDHFLHRSLAYGCSRVHIARSIAEPRLPSKLSQKLDRTPSRPSKSAHSTREMISRGRTMRDESSSVARTAFRNSERKVLEGSISVRSASMCVLIGSNDFIVNHVNHVSIRAISEQRGISRCESKRLFQHESINSRDSRDSCTRTSFLFAGRQITRGRNSIASD
jgi:hypothetical protein